MTLLEIIEYKRDGGALEAQHWGSWLQGVADGRVRPYHQAALNVALRIVGFSARERAVLYGLLAAEGILPEQLECAGIGISRGLFGGGGSADSHELHQILQRKIDGETLSENEIGRFIAGVTDQTVSDAQIAAFTMAVYLRSMSPDETVALTRAMLHSGRVLSWDASGGPVVDKHSTGGVGDKVSLPLMGALLACGFRVPMLSGRGLGHTGGTLDKLESIPGYRTNLSVAEIYATVGEVGGIIIGQTSDLAPADKRIYAIRDVVGTVSSIPLITASILSKKLAEGLTALVLDVKVGDGAFMKTREDAEALAQSLVKVGNAAGVRVSALLTDMNSPIGNTIGNACEVEESLQCLRGEGPGDLEALVVAQGAELLLICGLEHEPTVAEARVRATLHSGAALRAFARMVTAQGGRLEAFDPTTAAPDRELHGASLHHRFGAERGGFVSRLAAEKLGRAVVALGGGRRAAEDPVDPSVGIRIRRRVGDPVAAGEPILEVMANSRVRLEEALESIRAAVQISEKAPVPTPLILQRLRERLDIA